MKLVEKKYGIMRPPPWIDVTPTGSHLVEKKYGIMRPRPPYVSHTNTTLGKQQQILSSRLATNLSLRMRHQPPIFRLFTVHKKK